MFILIWILEIYLVIGFLFAIPFVVKWVNQMDSGAVDARWVFRLFIFPGVAFLWPLLLRKWLQSRKVDR